MSEEIKEKNENFEEANSEDLNSNETDEQNEISEEENKKEKNIIFTIQILKRFNTIERIEEYVDTICDYETDEMRDLYYYNKNYYKDCYCDGGHKIWAFMREISEIKKDLKEILKN